MYEYLNTNDLKKEINEEQLELNQVKKRLNKLESRINSKIKEYNKRVGSEQTTKADARESKFAISDVSNSLVADIRNKLTPIKNLCAMLKNSDLMYDLDKNKHKLIEKEIKQTLKSVEYLSNL